MEKLKDGNWTDEELDKMCPGTNKTVEEKRKLANELYNVLLNSGGNDNVKIDEEF